MLQLIETKGNIDLVSYPARNGGLGKYKVKGNMAPTKEMSIETMERIIKLLREGNPTRIVAKDIGCSQSAVSKIWGKYKQNGEVIKGKHTGRPRKTSKRQDKKLKAICRENKTFTTKEMKNKWAEIGVNVSDRTVRNRLNEMGFTDRKAKRKQELTPKQKKTKLQLAIEKKSWTGSLDDWMRTIFGDVPPICTDQVNNAGTSSDVSIKEEIKDD